MGRTESLRGATEVARDIWRVLPEEVTSSRWAQLARRILPLGTGAPVQRVVTSLDELDEMIVELEKAVRVSDDDLREGFQTFRMELSVVLPGDPFSAEYRDAVLDLYRWLHGAAYSPSNELTKFDIESATRRPFPYFTGSPATVGDYLIAVGHLIRTLGLGPGSRVLELGPGWGNVALPLAQLGCSVTAVDVCPEFVELIDRRAAQIGAELQVVTGDFSIVDEMDGPFDAVLFFESFHHSADHRALLRSLDRLLPQGGRIVFAAEPVYRQFWAPWGVRLDGESLWATRRNGWLELGFRRDYFEEVLRRHGWTARRVNCPETRWGQIFVAERSR